MQDRLRGLSESIETFALEVISGQRKGKRAETLRFGLFLLSKLFHGIVKTRALLYDFRIIRDSTLGVQVIAVGNLSVGGTGKTPVVEKFARELQAEGRKVAILSRGYRSKPAPFKTRLRNKLLFLEDETPPRIVSDGKKILLDVEMSGDEPYMLASNLKNVVVLVDKDRVKSGRYAIEKLGCDTLLLDDGFQYWKLRGRRHDVVLIDCQDPFGNGHLLPRGTLREPPAHLKRAMTVFITKSDGNTNELRSIIAKNNPRARIIECVHHPMYFEQLQVDPSEELRFDLEYLKDKKVASLSGIAQPESFENSLTRLGADLVYTKRFADHHRFEESEIDKMMQRSLKRGAEMVVTTQKDAVRIPPSQNYPLPILFMRVEIKILSGAKDFHDCVRQICFR